MPTSYPYQLAEIVDVLLKSHPKSVLDVGVGFGKYGVLAREYLEFWNGRQEYRDWVHRIDGIEIFGNYLTPLHEFVYDEVHIGDALLVLPSLTIRYDLILLIDVIEHFSESDGMRLLSLCRERARNVLISTPRDIGTQADAFGNPHETHRFQWTARHFRTLPNTAQLDQGEYSFIFFSGEDVARVRLTTRQRIGRNWPLLRRWLRTLRRLTRS